MRGFEELRRRPHCVRASRGAVGLGRAHWGRTLDQPVGECCGRVLRQPATTGVAGRVVSEPAYPRGVDLFIGSLFGFAASLGLAFVGAWLQSKREHRRWVREKRYEHVLRILRIASGEDWKHRHGDTFDQLRNQLAEGSGDVDKIEQRFVALQEAVAELGLIGPQRLHTLAVEFIVSAADSTVENNESFIRAQNAFNDAARRELGFDRA